MYFVLLRGWRSVFGDSVLAHRSLSAVCGLAALALLWALARRIYGTDHALLSALLFGASSYAVYYSQEVRPYSLLLLLAVGQLWLFFRAREEAVGGSGRVWTWLFWASAGVAAFGSLFAGLFTGALCLAHLIATKDRRQWLKLWLPAGLAMVPAALCYVDFTGYAASTGSISKMRQPLVLNAAFVPYGLLVGTTFGPPLDELRGASKLRALLEYAPHLALLLLAAGALAAAWAAGFARRAKDGPKKPTDALLVWLLVISFGLGVAFAALTGLNWLPRHAFYLLPVLALLLPGAVLADSGSARIRQLGVAGFVLLVALNLFSVGKYYFDPRHARDDYRGAAEYVRVNAGEQDKAIILWGLPDLLGYYGAQVIDGRGIRKHHLAEEVNRRSGKSPRVILLVNRPFYWDSDPEAIEKHMALTYRLEAKLALQQFVIYRFARRSENAAEGR
jgi:uncharacterized membrane protein